MQTDLKSFLISLVIWLFIFVSLLPLFMLHILLWILVFPFDRKKKVTHFFTMIWTRLYLTCNPGWKLRVQNREKIIRNSPCIFISNHQSIIDIALLLQLGVNFKWVSKIELAYVPFVGWVIWMNNHILVRRGNKQSVLQMAEACRNTLMQGIPVFVFPEGTRARDGQIQPFKEGAFLLARDNHVPIVPVVLDGTGDALPKKAFWLKPRQVFTVRVLDPVAYKTIERLDTGELMEYTRSVMSHELNDIRNQTA
jgi:1-acyl-sn-glycerol-3-phosphate acyltransferase